jgi:hypothetical protein
VIPLVYVQKVNILHDAFRPVSIGITPAKALKNRARTDAKSKGQSVVRLDELLHCFMGLHKDSRKNGLSLSKCCNRLMFWLYEL